MVPLVMPTSLCDNGEVEIMETYRITKVVSTKEDEDSKAIDTTLTLVFEGWTEQDFKTAAVKPSVINWQNGARKKTIPTSATYVVPRPGMKGGLVIDYMLALITGFGEAKAKVLCEKYGTAELAFKALEALLGE